MSAYIVEKNHILYLIAAAVGLQRSNNSFSYFHDGERHTLRAGDFEAAAEMAMMLWRENVISVGHRYPSGSSASLPGPIGEDYRITTRDIARTLEFGIEPVQVFKSIACYEYQSCEHDGWKASAAKAFCDSLREDACCAVVGYDDAVWGAPELPSKHSRR